MTKKKWTEAQAWQKIGYYFSKAVKKEKPSVDLLINLSGEVFYPWVNGICGLLNLLIYQNLISSKHYSRMINALDSFAWKRYKLRIYEVGYLWEVSSAGHKKRSQFCYRQAKRLRKGKISRIIKKSSKKKR